VNTTLSYNPEFIAQGSIIRNYLNPDMVLIGEATTEAGDMIEEVYHTVCDNKPHIRRMSPERYPHKSKFNFD
jgi:UDPglucose 6-dehydrogenase